MVLIDPPERDLQKLASIIGHYTVDFKNSIQEKTSLGPSEKILSFT
jgi:hypothetical protein